MAWVQCCRIFLCIVGIGLSIYALKVEVSKSHNDGYKAMCDISEHMSCSKVFSSKYGTGFGLVEPLLGKDSPLNVPNSIFGILFYSVVCLLGFSSSKLSAWMMFLSSILSCLGSFYLAYILYYILHDLCVVCLSTYVVNALLLVLNCISLRKANNRRKRKKE